MMVYPSATSFSICALQQCQSDCRVKSWIFALRKFPAVCGEKEVDHVVFEFRLALEIFIYHLANYGGSIYTK